MERDHLIMLIIRQSKVNLLSYNAALCNLWLISLKMKIWKIWHWNVNENRKIYCSKSNFKFHLTSQGKRIKLDRRRRKNGEASKGGREKDWEKFRQMGLTSPLPHKKNKIPGYVTADNQWHIIVSSPVKWYTDNRTVWGLDTEKVERFTVADPGAVRRCTPTDTWQFFYPWKIPP